MQLLPVLLPYIPPPLLRAVLADPRAAQPAAESFPAAVLFADVSGFTPLTEALAQRGAEGPEELTRLLNRCFGEIITRIAGEGGEVVKFSGDALTVLFSAVDEPLSHVARRALQAAQAVQEAMARTATLQTSAGPVDVGIKIGLGAGEALALRVGGVGGRWEYVLAGPALQQALQSEGQAGRGEIVLAAEAQALMHPNPLPPAPPAAPDGTAVPDLPAAEAVLRGYVPAVVRGWLEEGLRDWLAVLRPMSVLFVGAGGMDDSHPDGVRELQAFVERAQEVVARYEGSINKVAVDDKGTVLLALLGAPPQAHEDDAARAVRCAVELLAELAPLPVAVGVTTGHVFVGPVGSEGRREYTALGDAVNLAARLMIQAGPGNVLCDFATYTQAGQRLAFDSLPPVRVKGKAGLVRVYRPQAAAGPAPAGGRPQTRLVGRRPEMARLAAALDDVMAGRPRLLVVEGEAGIGKSRLVAELTRLARERGLAWLLGAGQSIERETPYRAWRDIFSYYFGLDGAAVQEQRRERVRRWVEDVAAEQLPRLPLLNDILALGLPDTAVSGVLDPALRFQNLALLVGALLRAWTRERPLLLVFEDAHWLDSLSWALTVAAARTLVAAGAPLLLVLTARPMDEGAPAVGPLGQICSLEGAETLALAALSPEEAVDLAAARLNLRPEELPAPVAGLVRARAGGNPFFAEELVLALRDQGVIALITDALALSGAAGAGPTRCRITGDLEQAGRTLPGTMQGLVLSRIDRLPPERQLTLKVGAVIGRSFPFAGVAYTMARHAPLPESRLRDHLEALAALDLTPLETPDPDRIYCFKHIITQEVAYGTLLFAQRRALHRTVAGWYEGQGEVAAYYPLLAHHYRYAEDREREGHYAGLAGRQAAAQFANAEAVRYLGRALELTPAEDVAGRCHLLRVRERVYDLQGNRDAQAQDLAALRDLVRALDDPEGRMAAEVDLRRASYAEVCSDFAGAITLAQAVAATAQAADLRAAAHLQWGRALWRQGDYGAAGPQFEQAIALAHAAGLPQWEADSLRNLGTVHANQGQLAEARTCFEQARQMYQESGDRRGVGNALASVGVVYYYQGDYTTAQAYHEQARQVYQEIGDRKGESVALTNLGLNATERGDYAGARVSLEQARVICRETGDRQGEGLVLNDLGLLCANEGDLQGALAYYEQALGVARDLGDRWSEGLALLNVGTIQVVLGGIAQARDALGRGLQISREIGDRREEVSALNYLGQLACGEGDFGASLEYGEQALALARASGFRKEAAQSWLVLGHTHAGLGRWAEAADAYRQVVEIGRELGTATVEAQAGLGLAALCQGDVEQARAGAEEIIPLLTPEALQGMEDPFSLCWMCYQVLDGIGDPRAGDILQAAQQVLQRRADRLGDEQARRLFLESVPARREIARALANREKRGGQPYGEP